jgi:hypothetical protein
MVLYAAESRGFLFLKTPLQLLGSTPFHMLDRGMNFTTYHYLDPRLRINGAISPRPPLHTFMSCALLNLSYGGRNSLLSELLLLPNLNYYFRF